MYGSVANADRIESQLKSQMVLFSKTPFVMDIFIRSIQASQN
jgi:hypothetical protein